jgi:hypothetical protein
MPFESTCAETTWFYPAGSASLPARPGFPLRKRSAPAARGQRRYQDLLLRHAKQPAAQPDASADGYVDTMDCLVRKIGLPRHAYEPQRDKLHPITIPPQEQGKSAGEGGVTDG